MLHGARRQVESKWPFQLLVSILIGGMPEWSNGAVSKTVVRLTRTEGSNPSPSATDWLRQVKPMPNGA